MKTFSSLRQRSVWAASLASLWMAASLVSAAPGGGGGGAATVGSAGGGGVAGGSVGGFGGGRGGASVGSFGGARGPSFSGGNAANVGAAPGQHIGSGLNGNMGTGRSFSPGFSNGNGFNGARLGNPVGNGQLVSPNFNNLSRPTFGNGQVANTGIVTNPGGVSGSTLRRGGTASIPRLGDARPNRTQPIYRAGVPVRNNAWTDARTPRVSPAARIGAAGRFNRAYDPGQGYLQNGGLAAPGQHLYPGASDYSAISAANNRPWHEGYRDGYRGRHQHYPYNYAALYYPYFYSGFFPAYYGGIGYGYGDYLGVDAPYSATISSGNVASNVDGTYGGYDQGAGAVARDPFDDQQLPANQPQVGPDEPTTESKPTVETGPDSLVEAVQGELVTRGYLSGKASGIYGDATREALRRFQKDQKLSATGRINEATLHALQLD